MAPPKKKAHPLEKRYAQLTARLAKLGPILQGTITERLIAREDPHSPGEQKTYGPYYQWTWKQQGKTVTVNLTPSQAKAYQKAIHNHRELQRVLKEMREVSLRLLEETTQSVKKRNRPK